LHAFYSETARTEGEKKSNCRTSKVKKGTHRRTKREEVESKRREDD
jgi:hypothetical protein